jgi:hypothetical protein
MTSERRCCPACPDDGYTWVTVGMDSSSPSGISVTYACWHGIEIDPPEWSVQAQGGVTA